MPTEERPARGPEKPQTDHHFETPVVREARPADATTEEREDGPDEAERPRRAGPSSG
jgi:hypothetical protein